MGRRKKSKHRGHTLRTWHPAVEEPPKNEDPLPVSKRELDFIDSVEAANFIMPRQFRAWRRFFLNEDNFLKCANQWLGRRIVGSWASIETDVDKGLMRRSDIAPEAYKPLRPYQPHYSDHGYGGWEMGHEPYIGKWTDNDRLGWSRDLPLIPKIEAPSGRCGVDFVLF